MRVALNAYLAHEGTDYRAAGVSVYTERLLRHLPVVAPQHEYLAYVGRDAPSVPGVTPVVSPVPTQKPAVRIVWEQVGLPAQVVRDHAALLHATVNVLPLLRPFPTVLTVHDLAFLRYPATFPRAKALYLRYAVTYSARAARRVIAVSLNTKQDMIELVRVPEDRIEVVHSGVDGRFRPLPAHDREQFRTRVFDGAPYILHVGTLQPRKNVDVLIRAFAQLKADQHIPHVLALIGARGWMYESLFRLVTDLGIQEQVKFVDYVHPDQLPLWYNCADVFTFPSAYEGFGLPVLEAMACGTPVVASASSSLIEVAGDAGMMVEPGSAEALVEGVGKILNDGELRCQMRDSGFRHVAGWTWDATARATALVYEKVGQDS